MACRVRYLNAAGIMPREIKGIDALAKAFPADWLFYVALNCYPRGQDPMEIDGMVVLDDQVLLLEIKDWNGKLTNRNGAWFINGQNRGRSAVTLTNEKARKLKTVLSGELPGIGSNLWIEPRVVLTGSATKDHLPDAEKAYVWSLQEARLLGDSSKRASILQSRKIRMFKFWQFEKDFDAATGNVKVFQRTEADWAGFRVVEQDVFVHPRGVWKDHRGERKKDDRVKAMIRTWAFDKLPVGLNSPDRRELIAQRESKAVAHLTSEESSLIERKAVLAEVSFTGDEILTNHFEVRDLRQGMVTLDRYLEKFRDDLTDDDRLTLAANLITMVAELHDKAVSHRDLGARCVWVRSSSVMSLTGLMSSQLPGEESVVDWLTALRGYAPSVPEDQEPVRTSTGKQRDVYLTSYLTAMLLTGEKPGATDEARPHLPTAFAPLEEWLQRGLSTNPVDRFPDCIEMSEAFADIVENLRQPPIDHGLLDRFETDDIPYVKWTTSRSISKKGGTNIYESDSEDGTAHVVKVWNSFGRGINAANDLALIRLLDSATRVRDVPIAGLPIFVDLGLSPVGAYVVYKRKPGVPIRDLTPVSSPEALGISLQLVQAVKSLHDLGCDHGDISPANVIYDAATRELSLIDPFDISPVGDGKIRTPALCPENWERLSQHAVDRYATLSIVREIIARQVDPALSMVEASIKVELERPIIETLEPIIAALQRDLDALNLPASQRFVLRTNREPEGFDFSATSYYVSRRPADAGMQRYAITSVEGQLYLDGIKGNLVRIRFQRHNFVTLAHESGTSDAVELKFALSLAKGEDEGFDALYLYLESQFPDLTPVRRRNERVVRAPTGFNVARHWERMIDLESNDRVEIEIVDVLTVRDGVSIYRFTNLGRVFDFDPDATIEVYFSGNKRVGEVEISLSDFSSVIAVRHYGRGLSEGDHVYLADRREQVSIDRRTKAVKRILDRQSAIPNLIEFFHPDSTNAGTVFDSQIADEQLSLYALNPGQEQAFKQLLTQGPVGLLQGPPGTGKTWFIASFVHWLATVQNQRILITSQSHEAVNNVIVSLLRLYKKNGGQPNLLRIGSKGITDRIRPFHTAELREKYRVRFESAAKHRYVQLTSARGLSKAFSNDVFDLDHNVGRPARRCANLLTLVAQDTQQLAVDRERQQSQLKQVQNAFKAAAKHALGIAVDPDKPLDEVEEAFRLLLRKHSDYSASDLVNARDILAITNDWLSSLASPQRNFEEFLAKTRSLVTATCVGVGQARIRVDSQIFDWVIVDEAARCTPGELAVPIQMGRRILLVGDHLQLQPMISRFVINQLVGENRAAREEVFLQSDFERAFVSTYGKSTGQRFTEQYRMDPAICEMVSKFFYEPHEVKLVTSDKRESSLVFPEKVANFLAQPITWIDTSSAPNSIETQLPGQTTISNNGEIAAIIQMLEIMSVDAALVEKLDRLDEETPIGIICMYTGQKEKMEMAWARHPWDARFRRMVRIDTVDGYQGKENSIVVISLVRNNVIRVPGHVRRPFRCNVALSRAKERVIIVGSAEMWGDQPDESPMKLVLGHICANENSGRSRKIAVEGLQ